MDKPIVCMLHTGINRFVTETMAGVKEEERQQLLKQVQYLALGHIHSRYENPEKKYFNPGSLECVRITDNPFGKGFYLVNLNKKTYEIETQYKVVKNRNSINKSIDITLLEDDENTLIRERKEAIGKINDCIETYRVLRKQEPLEKIPEKEEDISFKVLYLTDNSGKDYFSAITAGHEKKYISDVSKLVHKLEQGMFAGSEKCEGFNQPIYRLASKKSIN